MNDRTHAPLRNPVLPVHSEAINTSLLLDVLTHFNGLIASEVSFEDFCDEVGKLLKEKLRFSYTHIWIRDTAREDVLILVTPEESNKFRTASVDKGIIGKAFRENMIITVPDVSKETEYINAHPEIKSEICIPLVARGQSTPLGVLNIEHDQTEDFSSHIPTLKIIAENLTHAVQIALWHKMEREYKHVVDRMTEGLCLINKEGVISYANKMFCNYVGEDQHTMAGKRFNDFIEQSSRDKFIMNHRTDASDVPCTHEFLLQPKEGDFLPVLTNIAPFHEGWTIITCTDLRPIKATESKLRRAEQLSSIIMQNCEEAIISFSIQGKIQSWNVGAERMFGFKADEMMGTTETSFMPTDRLKSGELRTLLEEVKHRGYVRNFETIRLNKMGKPLYVSVTMSPLKDDKGIVYAYSALYRDITTQKKWERELQDRFEKMQDAYREMGRQRRYMDFLMEIINMATNPHSSTKTIANYIVNAVIIIARVDAATIRIMDHQREKLTLVAYSGLNEEWWSKKSIPYEGSLLESAIKSGTSLKILDVVNNQQYVSPSLARKNNLRSALVIPLEVKGEVMGSLTLYLSYEGNLGLLDEEFITMFAKQASIALKLTTL
ncbi:PAS domain S-box protein [Candidatus Gracilibacteria bacterium]|nr:PAS domain S-box protein [Candidatus Gracilibacteria bacterium]